MRPANQSALAARAASIAALLALIAGASAALATEPLALRAYPVDDDATLELAVPKSWKEAVREPGDEALLAIDYETGATSVTVRVHSVEDLEASDKVAEGAYGPDAPAAETYVAILEVLGRHAMALGATSGTADLDIDPDASSFTMTIEPPADAAPEAAQSATIAFRPLDERRLLTAALPTADPDAAASKTLRDLVASAAVLHGGVRHAPVEPTRIDGRHLVADGGRVTLELPPGVELESLGRLGLAWRVTEGGKPRGSIGLEIYEGATGLVAFERSLKLDWVRAGRQIVSRETRKASGVDVLRCRWRDTANGVVIETAQLVHDGQGILLSRADRRGPRRLARELDAMLSTLTIAGE